MSCPPGKTSPCRRDPNNVRERATPPVRPRPARKKKPQNLDNLLDRLTDIAPELLKQASHKPDANSVAGGAVGGMGGSRRNAGDTAAAQPSREPTEPDFFPEEPTTFRDAGLNDGMVEELVVKYLLATGENTGHGVSDQLKLPFPLISEFMAQVEIRSVGAVSRYHVHE